MSQAAAPSSKQKELGAGATAWSASLTPGPCLCLQCLSSWLAACNHGRHSCSVAPLARHMRVTCASLVPLVIPPLCPSPPRPSRFTPGRWRAARARWCSPTSSLRIPPRSSSAPAPTSRCSGARSGCSRGSGRSYATCTKVKAGCSVLGSSRARPPPLHVCMGPHGLLTYPTHAEGRLRRRRHGLRDPRDEAT